jgi:GNAT superfamily N-acetyltransferase
MTTFDVKVSCPVHDSFRVQQVAGMFDVPLAEKATERFQVELPTDENDWQIGLIVGPSGSGKSTVARHAFKKQLYQPTEWPSDRAVVDCFGDLPARRVVELFTAVGFGSPPSWVKPFHVLSCGEQFRCDLARALAVGVGNERQGDKEKGRQGEDTAKPNENDPCISLSPGLPVSLSSLPLVVFDEFTSVVDRTVAKVCSAAIAMGIRSGNLRNRFVAVTCHYDVAEWLEPDWVLDMATGRLERRCLRRPKIELSIHRCSLAAWELFKRHHYLNAALNPAARCYVATWNGESAPSEGCRVGDTGCRKHSILHPPSHVLPVFFCATLPIIGKYKHRRFTRIVTLPDFQGIGIGMRAMGAVAELHRAEGLRINVTSSHPALIRHCRRSPLWKAVSVKKSGGSRGVSATFPQYRSSAGRSVVSFEYVGDGREESFSFS